MYSLFKCRPIYRPMYSEHTSITFVFIIQYLKTKKKIPKIVEFILSMLFKPWKESTESFGHTSKELFTDVSQ